MPSQFDDYPRRPHATRISPWAILAPLIFVGGAVLLALWSMGAFHRSSPDHDPNAQARPVAPKPELDAIERERIDLFKNVKDSVVNVDTLVLARDRFDLVERQFGTGSGFIWNDQGHIVTNFHVIRSALTGHGQVEVRVVLADRSAYNAHIIGASPESDLAVLKIDAPKSKLKPIRVGSSHDLEVGQTCYAIGNPFGQSLTLTSGIVSALDREIQSEVAGKPITGAIQTDAALNPGNSGGPLLDRGGRLIGVNTAIASPSGGSVGIGFSIPVDTVQRVIPELIRNEIPARAVMGIRLVPDRDVSGVIDKGVMILAIVPNGPAAKAGLRGVRETRNGGVEIGDVILRIDDDEVNSTTDLSRVMSKHKPGETVKLTVQRGQESFTIDVALQGA